MADINRTASLRKNLQKHAGRAKELFSQRLGRADKTTNEGFDEYVRNFNAQQNASVRLTKEVKNYNNCVKALQSATKSLMELICELYEEHWIDHDKVQVKAELLNEKWTDFFTTVDDQVVKPLIAYSEQFIDVNNKIMKRRRKLLDYDCCRHTIQNLEHSMREKKREEARLNKAKEQLTEKQTLYETINSELMDELPALWDSRVAFLASNFQCLFIAEATFHNQSFKIFSDLNDVVETLAIENQKGVYAIKRYPGGECFPAVPSAVSAIPMQGSGEGESSSSEYLSAEALMSSDTENFALKEKVQQKKVKESPTSVEHDEQFDSLKSDKQAPKVPVKQTSRTATDKGKISPTLSKQESSSENSKNQQVSPSATDQVSPTDKKQDLFEPMEESPLPPGVLQRVRAVFQYVAEDTDELCFEPGDIICVTNFDDPEQQEEGWLMGYKEGTSEKGLFPANFTRQIQDSSFSKADE